MNVNDNWRYIENYACSQQRTDNQFQGYLNIFWQIILCQYFTYGVSMGFTLFFISYVILNITLLLKINSIKLLEEEYLIQSAVSAILRAPAKIPFNKE